MSSYAIVKVTRKHVVLLLAVTAVAPILSQDPPPQTPLAGAGLGETRSPTGGRLAATYDTSERGLQVLAPQQTVALATVAPRVAERILPRLPEGFSLGDGTTRMVMNRGGDTALAPPRPASKFVTLFPLRYRAIPLSKGSDYLAMTSSEGRLLALRQRGMPTEVDATVPTVGAADAVRVASEHARPALAGEEPITTTPQLEIWVGEDQTGTLTWTFGLQSTSQQRMVVRQYWIKATGTPTIANWESRIFTNHNGTVTATIWRTPNVRAHDRPLPSLGVNRQPNTMRVFTAEDGSYKFPTGTGKANIQAALGGISCVSQNVGGPNLVRIRSGDTASALDLDFDASGDLELSQTSGYFWCEFAHSFSQLGVNDLRQLPARVNLDFLTCNAFYNSNEVTLNFFQAGGGCPNTAHSDIVLHEYGHAVDDDQGGILDGGYSEGFGDVLAILATEQPCAGRQLFGADTCLRDAREVVTWPPANEEAHQVGRIYAGFVWELVQQLIPRLGEAEAFKVATDLSLAAAAANPSDIPDAVRLTFLADDDDGDPATCSPHFAELAAAAASRKIPRPPASGPGTLDVKLEVSPQSDPGRFNLFADGTLLISNAGDGASTGPRSLASGKHSITQSGASGTDLSDYQTFFGGACAADGGVAIPACLHRTCTVTNVLAKGQDCEKQCREERDQCLKDPEMTPQICLKLFKACLASCNGLQPD